MDLLFKITDWLLEIKSTQEIPKDIVAFNFGIFESEDDYKIYLVGSKSYDADDNDWACNEDFIPNTKYFNIPVELTDGKTWGQVQSLVVETLRKYFVTNKYQRETLGMNTIITTGFDDGDLIRII